MPREESPTQTSPFVQRQEGTEEGRKEGQLHSGDCRVSFLAADHHCPSLSLSPSNALTFKKIFHVLRQFNLPPPRGRIAEITSSLG